jgi:uncharacterized protein YutE (UPF0331/DUF86 family)
MSFAPYLASTRKTAETEKEVLDLLYEKAIQTGALDKIEIRAARASMQIIIENAIGKARRILKHYNCPLVPSRARDALVIMYDTGLLSDEMYQSLMAAVGFRNAMIHDYMNFDENVLLGILRDKKYLDIHDFLIEEPSYGAVQLKRVESYTV